MTRNTTLASLSTKCGLFVALLIASLACLPRAHAAVASWIIYGATPGPGEALSDLLYDAGSITHGSDGHVTGWLIAVDDDALAKILDGPQGDALVHEAARKIGGGYVPPFNRVQAIDKEHVATLVLEELAVNKGLVQPLEKAHFEIDCPKQLFRALSITHYTPDGQVASTKSAPEWGPMPAGSPMLNLAVLVCGTH